MIKFFRKIRMRLLAQNRLNKYLVYAIGEIVLVVIGILIALQINNWNEQKKLELEYISDLKAIKENLEKDALNLSVNIANGSRYAKEFLQQLNTNSLVIKGSSIIIQLSRPGLYFDYSNYNSAKSKNTLNLIQNDSLKSLFHEYYVRQTEIAKRAANRLDEIGSNLKLYYLESGHQMDGISRKEVMNKIMQQDPFIDYLMMYNSERESVIEELKSLKSLNEKLSKTIDAELKHIE